MASRQIVWRLSCVVSDLFGRVLWSRKQGVTSGWEREGRFLSCTRRYKVYDFYTERNTNQCKTPGICSRKAFHPTEKLDTGRIRPVDKSQYIIQPFHYI
jgi:hypothetical protein